MLARAWSVSGLEDDDDAPSRTRRRLLFAGAALLALAITAWPLVHDLRALLGGDSAPPCRSRRTSGDTICLALVAPVMQTALAMRGGVLRWPWGLLTSSGIAWIVFDAASGVVEALHVSGAHDLVVTEAFRALACGFVLAAGLAQRCRLGAPDARLTIPRSASLSGGSPFCRLASALGRGILRFAGFANPAVPVWARIRQLWLQLGRRNLPPPAMLERKTVDAAEPPRIVFESPAACRESDRAEDLLRRTLLPRRVAPGAGWVVTHARRPHEREGAARARARSPTARARPSRTGRIAATTADCGGLARAVGVWASLVLDEEVRRASTVATQRPARRAGADAHPAGGRRELRARARRRREGAAGDDRPRRGRRPRASRRAQRRARGRWPAPCRRREALARARLVPAPRRRTRTLEAGAGVFLMTGTGGGALAGPTAFVVVEAGHGLFLRPSLAFGQSLTSLPPSDVSSSTWAAARFDTCLRLPGLYTQHHGMQLDLCGGLATSASP